MNQEDRVKEIKERLRARLSKIEVTENTAEERKRVMEEVQTAVEEEFAYAGMPQMAIRILLGLISGDQYPRLLQLTKVFKK